MAYAASHQEPYTKYPNRYVDTLKPNLTSIQRDICDLVIRMTNGWHRSSAPISISKFVDKTGKSRRSIITAKQQLIDMGLLVEVEHGGGIITSEYVLDLYYNRDKSIQHEQLSIEDKQPVQDDVSIDDCQHSDATVHVEPTISDVSATTTDVSTSEPNVDIVSSMSNNDVDTVTAAPDDECNMNIAPQTIPECNNSDTNTHSDDEYNLDAAPLTITPEVPSVTSNKSDSTMHLEPGTIEVDDLPGGANNAPLPYKDLDLSIININKKHTEAATSKVGSEVGSDTNTIRCLFYKLFPTDSDTNDWGFFGYIVTTYGMEACRSKIDYMAEHRKSHTITNPKGFLRRALEHDYQIPRSILLKIKADEAARLAAERTRRNTQEWRSRVSNYDYGSSMAALNKLMETLN